MDSRLIWQRPDLRAYQGLYTNAAHNEFLQEWAELGIVGLFLFMTLVGLAFYALLKDMRWVRPAFLPDPRDAGRPAAGLAGAGADELLAATPRRGADLLPAAARRGAGETDAAGGRGLPVTEHGKRPADLTPGRADDDQGDGGWGWRCACRAPLAVALGVLLLAAALAWAAVVPWRPVRAQSEYARAVAAEGIDPKLADAHYQRIIAIDPAMTNARSRYSDWLIKQGRAAEGLAELQEVRRRLNSNELWEREARGLEALGKKEEALKAMGNVLQTAVARAPDERDELPKRPLTPVGISDFKFQIGMHEYRICFFIFVPLISDLEFFI